MHSNLRQGATTAEKLRGPKVWVPTQGRGPTPGRLRPAPGQRSGWVLDAGGGRSLPLWGSGGITTGKYLKTQMLNLAFWWLLAVKFLAVWKQRSRSWGTITLLFPQPTSWGPVSPGPYGCCAYAYLRYDKNWNDNGNELMGMRWNGNAESHFRASLM